MNPSTPRLPANYRVVLDVVNEYGAGRHATAQDVFERARQLRPGIGFTTVHRGLARLHELGYVLKLDISGEGSAMYEPATGSHAHFRCTACGAVEDVDFTPATRPPANASRPPRPRDPQRIDHVHRPLQTLHSHHAGRAPTVTPSVAEGPPRSRAAATIPSARELSGPFVTTNRHGDNRRG
jgi:Fe2+ or Zn2+ uptake regulation protein